MGRRGDIYKGINMGEIESIAGLLILAIFYALFGIIAYKGEREIVDKEDLCCKYDDCIQCPLYYECSQKEEIDQN